MMNDYCTRSISFREIIPLREVSTLDPTYLSTAEAIQSTGTTLPIIVSKNNYLLDGHKTVEYMKQNCVEQKTPDKHIIAVIVLNKDLSKKEAWNIHRILNKKLPINYTEDSFDDRYQLSQPGKIKNNITSHLFAQRDLFSELYALSGPIKPYILARMVASKLSSIPWNIHQGLTETLVKTFATELKS